MHTIKQLILKLRTIDKHSKIAIKLGILLMFCFYIIALAVRLYVPYSADYFATMAIYRGCLEAAPAFLAVGFCAGLLGDLMLSSTKQDSDSPDER